MAVTNSLNVGDQQPNGLPTALKVVTNSLNCSYQQPLTVVNQQPQLG